MPQPTLFAWLRRGRLRGHQVPHAAHSLWLIHTNAQDLEQLQAWRAAAQAERQIGQGLRADLAHLEDAPMARVLENLKVQGVSEETGQ